MGRLCYAAILIVAVACTPWRTTATTSAAGTALNLVVVGDSLTYTGVTAPDGWAGLLANDLNTQLGTTTNVANFGRNNATSGDILSFIESDATVRAALRNADLVTYQAGINDFLQARGKFIFGLCGGADNQDCLRQMVADFVTNWDRIVTETGSLSPFATFRAMDIYYPVAAYDESQGLFATLNTYLSQMNTHIAAHPGGAAAGVHTAFNGADGTDDPIAKGYILPDAVHPTWLGQLTMFFRVKILGYSGITPHPWSVGGIAEAPALSAGKSSGAGGRRRPQATVAALSLLLLLAAVAVRRRGRRSQMTRSPH